MDITIDASTWAIDAQCQEIGEALGDQFYPMCRARGNELEPRSGEVKAAIDKALTAIDLAATPISEGEIKSRIRHYMRGRILDLLKADGVDVGYV